MKNTKKNLNEDPEVFESESKIGYSFEEQTFIENRAYNYLPNSLVISHAHYSRIEQKIFEFFINQIDFTKTREYSANTGLIVRIPLVHISKHIKYADLKTYSKTLGAKPITIEGLSKEKKKDKFTHIFPFISIDYNPDEGFLEFYTSPKMSPFLFYLEKQYARYKFESVLSFKSIYSTPFYKVLRMHIGQNRYTFTYSIEDLRQMLGVEEGKYPNLKDFKKYVIVPAQRELAEVKNEPIFFEFENHGGKQRNVTHLVFKIINSITISNQEKEELEVAISQNANPHFIVNQARTILQRDYNIPEHLKAKILEDGSLLSRFINLDIELNAGIYKNVKNPTAWMLACLDLVKKRTHKKPTQ